jgi:sulfoxide reductase heme-binding subunit YedZ
MHLTTSPIDWYAARAAGVIAYAVLTGVVLIGVTMAGRKRFERWPRFALEDVHRFGGLFLGSLVAIHVIAIAIDAWLPFSLQALVVPFMSRYRPVWVGLGVAAAELLIALAVTNHYRRKMRYRVWRRAHYLNFAVWTAATLHGVGSGTDRSAPWTLALYAAATSSVAAATVWRLTRRRWGVARVAPLAGLAAALAAIPLVELATGPLAFKPKPWNAANFHEPLVGRVARIAGTKHTLVTMTGEGIGRQHVLVRVDLLLEPTRVAGTALRMQYLPGGARCNGALRSAHRYMLEKAFVFRVEGVCHMRNGERRVVTAQWRGGVAWFSVSALGTAPVQAIGFVGNGSITHGTLTSHA